MYSYKENSNLPPPSHFKTPYSRPNSRSNSTVSKILKKSRTSENNYGRSPAPSKQIASRNLYSATKIQNYDELPTFYDSYECVDEVYGISITSHSKPTRSDCEPVHFRPRKSQIANRMLETSFDQSLELKMMTIDDPEISESPKKLKASQELSNKGFQIKPRQNLLRIFTGSVENVLHWSKLKTGLHILFEVTAIVDSIQQGKWKTEKKFCLSDSKSGPKIQVVYHEIDRPLPKLVTQSLVTCTGRLISRNCLQAYKIEETTEDEKRDLQRLSFICNRVADELAASQKK